MLGFSRVIIAFVTVRQLARPVSSDTNDGWVYLSEEKIEIKHHLQVGEEIFVKILGFSHNYFGREERLEAG